MVRDRSVASWSTGPGHAERPLTAALPAEPSGEQIFRQASATCHAVDGSGSPQSAADLRFLCRTATAFQTSRTARPTPWSCLATGSPSSAVAPLSVGSIATCLPSAMRSRPIKSKILCGVESRRFVRQHRAPVQKRSERSCRGHSGARVPNTRSWWDVRASTQTCPRARCHSATASVAIITLCVAKPKAPCFNWACHGRAHAVVIDSHGTAIVDEAVPHEDGHARQHGDARVPHEARRPRNEFPHGSERAPVILPRLTPIELAVPGNPCVCDDALPLVQCVAEDPVRREPVDPRALGNPQNPLRRQLCGYLEVPLVAVSAESHRRRGAESPPLL